MSTESSRLVGAAVSARHASSLATTEQPVKVRPVGAAVSQQETANVLLNETITELEQRLGAVLTSLPPANVGSDVKMARHTLALQIEANAVDTRSLAERLGSIIARLEV